MGAICLTQIPHLLFKNRCECHQDCSLKARTIARIALTIILAITSILTFLFCIAPVSYIVGGVLAGVTLTILILTLVAAIKHPRKPHPIPKKLLKIIKTNYPRPLVSFIIEKQLSFQEINQLIVHRRAQAGLPNALDDKLQEFGVKRLDKINFHSLDDIEILLSRYCPLYWFRLFTNLDEFHEDSSSKTIAQRAYQTLGRFVYQLEQTTIFQPLTYAILKEITPREQCQLRIYAKALWNHSEAKKICEQIYNRIDKSWHKRLKAEEGLLKDFPLTKEGVRHLLLLLSIYDMDPETQATLISGLDWKSWIWLCKFNTWGGHPFQIAKLGGFLSSCDKFFDDKSIPGGITWEEMASLVENNSKNHPDVQPAHALAAYLLTSCPYLSQKGLTQGSDLDQLMYDHVKNSPMYSINPETGARTLKGKYGVHLK
ncbi:Protein of unknown function (DUF1389) [Chlamydia serpentis]|uniref:DUF1389 domain-containing protein n=1 Tax=Chlamydia serpentis TaxID=1967782 RepID=A0A2R8FAP4_9CHLA|nr:DUF1389 domain-containing protein [Chlamydia serpentis]SPN73493.1 Protein of unknown function (DUF1389) [Chlamydia serpentis]